MDVEDLLARVGPAVQDEPVSRLVDSLFLSEPGSHPDHATKRGLVRLGHVGDGRNGLIGDNENVGRRLRLDIPTSRHQFVLIDKIGGDFASDDLREYRVRHAEHRSALERRVMAMQSLPATPPR